VNIIIRVSASLDRPVEHKIHAHFVLSASPEDSVAHFAGIEYTCKAESVARVYLLRGTESPQDLKIIAPIIDLTETCAEFKNTRSLVSHNIQLYRDGYY
jgi:hypothetical protein